ncbi:hypothetical protein Ddc_19984 [Ditylenchus destructor]|nr:hypothetical protein Ddc_19984 [Ditylenchus destructor]
MHIPPIDGMPPIGDIHFLADIIDGMPPIPITTCTFWHSFIIFIHDIRPFPDIIDDILAIPIDDMHFLAKANHIHSKRFTPVSALLHSRNAHSSHRWHAAHGRHPLLGIGLFISIHDIPPIPDIIDGIPR